MSNLLPCVEIGSADSTHSIIWLHGLGADGHDFEPIANELNITQAVRYIFPHAPTMPVTVNNGMTMPAWYDISSAQIDNMQDDAGIRKSQNSILALIEREIQRGIKSSNIILAGFSQGGAIALHTGLRYEQPLAGIMGLSTYLPLIDSVKTEIHNANRKTPIMLAHGAHDPIVPFKLAEKTKHFLMQQDYTTELHSYVMEHSVCPEEINDISDWINKCFS